MKRKWLAKLLIFALSVSLLAPSGVVTYADEADVVIPNDETGIPDANLYAAILKKGDSNSDNILTIEEAEKIDLLYADSKKISNIQGIQYCKNLEYLYIDDNKISDISPLENMTTLKALVLDNNPITDISVLSTLTKLQTLGLAEISLTDISQLKTLTQLTSLYLDDNCISDIRPLKTLTRMRMLYLNNNQISDISVLENMQQLVEVHLNNNRITDTSVFDNMKFLACIELSGNPCDTEPDILEDTSAVILNDESGIPDENLYSSILNVADRNGDGILTVSEAESITRLHIAYRSLSSLQGIQYCKNLKVLFAFSNYVEDISMLEELTQLTGLSLGANGIKDISVLKNLTNLEHLELQANNSSDYSAISNLTKLKTLNLAHTSISDLTVLSSLTELNDLTLPQCNISDVSPLSNLKNLTYLDLSYNQITNKRPLNSLTNLVTLKLEGNPCEDMVENPFTDVPESMYYYEPVLWALENNITAGLTATEFAPEAVCTRGQVVTFLWRAMGQPESVVAENPFVDVNSNQYYYKAVLWALENGITAGLDATHFAPDATVTRGQFVTFLHRTENTPFYSVSNPFVDVPENTYYTNAVLWALENGVTAGLDATHFAPEDFCTRGQVVTFLYRALNK